MTGIEVLIVRPANSFIHALHSSFVIPAKAGIQPD